MAINEEHAKLERELLDAHNVIQKYHSKPGRWKSVTESEYKAAVQAFQAATDRLAELDDPTPPNPYADMTLDALRKLYDEKKTAYVSRGSSSYNHNAATHQWQPDVSAEADLMRIMTQIQRLESEQAGA